MTSESVPDVSSTQTVLTANRDRVIAPLVSGLLMVTWFVAPLTSAGFGAVKLVDVMLLIDMAVVFLLSRREVKRDGLAFFPRVARRHVIAILLLGGGLLVGAFRQDRGLLNAIQTVQYPLFALFPIFLLLRVRPSEKFRLLLVQMMIAGTLLSIGTGALGGELTARGRIYGLTTHENQLGMTAMCALPLLMLLYRGLSRRLRVVAWTVGVICFLGVNLSGSRAALVGALVFFLLYGILRLRRWLTVVPSLVLIVAVLGVGFLVIKPQASTGYSATSIQRLQGDQGSANSDAARAELLSTGISDLSVGSAVVGGVYLKQYTHNIFLTVLLLGGSVALSGLLLAVVPWMFKALSISIGACRKRFNREVYYYSLTITAFMVWISFNNAIWVRYFWCIMALLVMAQISADEETDPLQVARTADV
jgi:O-antigen ligase